MRRKISGKGFSERYFGDSIYIKTKLSEIFGEGDYTKKCDEIQKENRKRTIWVFFLIAVLAVSMIMSEAIGFRFVRNSEGDLWAVDRGDSTVSQIPVTVKGNYEGKDFSEDIVLNISGKEEDEDEEEYRNDVLAEESLDMLISQLIEDISSDVQGKRIRLPDSLADGTSIRWEETGSSNMIVVAVMSLFLAFALYRMRYDRIKKMEETARESVMNELPGFLNRLVLTINAGLVFNTAYERIITEKEKTGWSEDSYFYGQLIRINRNVRENNCSLQNELADFARRTQSREFIRAVGIINDNISKGVVLTDKLRGESEALWFARRSYIEEKGKLAETKLIGPLVLLLLILIVITVAPAMMEM